MKRNQIKTGAHPLVADEGCVYTYYIILQYKREDEQYPVYLKDVHLGNQMPGMRKRQSL